MIAAEDDPPRIDLVLRIIAPRTPRSRTSRTGRHSVRDAMHISTAIRYGARGFVTPATTD